MSIIHFSWWNLENLFDIENYPDRTDKLNRTLKDELKGWDQTVLDTKLTQLSSIINRLNDNNGPDILGVCEVENRHVLELLVAKLNRATYDIVHADTKDARGIDVAFIYDKNIFTTKKEDIFSHFVMKRTATRDIVQVNFTMKQGNKKIVAIGNHWPSRSAGQYESEPYRMIAGETLAYFHEQIYVNLPEGSFSVIAAGDFNDTPHNRSVMEYALSVNNKKTVTGAKTKKYFFNLMWQFLAAGEGTYYYDGFDLLDQFMVSEEFLKNNSGFSIVGNSCCIETFDLKKPKPFGRPSKKSSYHPDGYSDHFPISVKLNVV